MKINNFVLLILVLMVSFKSAACERERENCVWPSNKLPLRFTMDNNNIAGYLASLNIVPDTNKSREHFIAQAQTWNGDYYFIQHPLVGPITLGNVNPMPDERDGRNEITFSYWNEDLFDSDGLGKTFIYSTRENTIITPYSFETPIILEADIFINPKQHYYIGTTVPNNCTNIQYTNVETIIKHEIGHALGHKRHLGVDYDSRNLMRDRLLPCESREANSSMRKAMSILYPSRMTVDINVQSPTPNQVLIINQSHNFTANITGLSSKKSLSLKEMKDVEDSMIWVSSLDGEIGTGNNISPLLLTGGQHELTVTIGEPGDAIYGEGFSTYFVVDTTSDIVDQYGRTIAYPFPCVRSVDRNDDACLFTVLDSVDTTPDFLFGCKVHPIGFDSNPSPFSEDFNTTGNNVRFDMHIEPFPQCSSFNPGRKYFAYTSWVYDAITLDTVDFHLYTAWRELIQNPSRIWNVRYDNMPLVDPEIYVDTPSDCNVTNITERCGVEISWTDKYFLPDAGVFYKANGSSNWTFAQVLTEDNVGTINTGNIVGVDGGQLAIFQYSQDVRTPNSGHLMISAPSGMVAGPFSVKAISSDTTPTTPDLVSAETSCNHNYCISLSGHNFGTDSYVDIRGDLNGGPVLKTIQGNDIYNRNPVNGLEGIFFPIQDFDLQNKLNTTGLCFWVVNPPEFSNAVCTTRPSTSPQGPFMGKTVESYKQGTQDMEYTSYTVVGNGEKLRLLGNSWKKIAYNYTVTPNTVLEFKFKSRQQQAEINGIGFIMNGSTTVAGSKLWQVYGTQGLGGRNHDFHDYPGTGWKTYRIPIGETFTGQISDMVFAGDEDSHVGQNVIYKSPVLIEEGPTPDEYDDEAIRGYTDDYEGDAVAWPGGSSTVQNHNFHDSGDVDWTMVWISSTGTKSFKAEMIGANSDTKIKVYKVTDGIENPAYPGQGRLIINSWELVASDSSVGDSFVTVNADAGFLYVMKTESRTGHSGAGTEYQVKIRTVAHSPDEYDDIALRGYTDDNEGDAVAWPGGASTVQNHNFHDSGDVDWTMVWISSSGTRSFRADMIGVNSDTKIKVYKVTDGIENPNYPGQGRIIINSWVLVGSDSSTGNSFVSVATEADTLYIMKTESKTGTYGPGTNYRVRIN